MSNKKDIEILAKKLWSENAEVAEELANLIVGISDGDYDEPAKKKSTSFKVWDGNKFVNYTFSKGAKPIKEEVFFYNYEKLEDGEIMITNPMSKEYAETYDFTEENDWYRIESTKRKWEH